MEGRCFAAEARIPKISHQLETGRGHQGREFFDQFTIAHDDVRRAVAPGRFHPIREAAGCKTLQALDSQRRSQHIAAQIFQALLADRGATLRDCAAGRRHR